MRLSILKAYGLVAATCLLCQSVLGQNQQDTEATVEDEDIDDDASPLMTPPIPPSQSKYVAPDTPKYDYAEVLHKSFLFYHAQKSGILPYQRMAWRGDSCKMCVGDFNEDVSRGWYEAANTMKWGLPFGWTATQLAFNVVMFEDAMNSVDELAEGLELLKWGGGKFADYTHICICRVISDKLTRGKYYYYYRLFDQLPL